jgi:hypothetical protein
VQSAGSQNTTCDDLTRFRTHLKQSVGCNNDDQRGKFREFEFWINISIRLSVTENPGIICKFKDVNDS